MEFIIKIKEKFVNIKILIKILRSTQKSKFKFTVTTCDIVEYDKYEIIDLMLKNY